MRPPKGGQKWPQSTYLEIESGLYYLQSRYYDPAIGRFINADVFTSTGEGVIGYNMFAYCNNNPCLYIDPFGYDGFVGVGFQVDISTDHGTFGVEIVIYFDADVVYKTTQDKQKSFAIAMYTYSGISISQFEIVIAPQIAELAHYLDFEKLNDMTTDEIIITLSALLTEYQLSGSAFAIYGYDNFDSADSYSGRFDSWSASASKPMSSLNGGVYYSYSDTCWAVGVKVGASNPKFHILPIDIQYSQTYYSDPVLLH